MKLWKVRIKAYHFGVFYYDLFVLADTESNMLRTIRQYPKHEDATIEDYVQINLENKTNRVL